MNRLQKKCFIASTGIHLLLALILLIGPAFLTSNRKPDDFHPITFIPSMLVDEPTRPGGGNPGAAQPPPQPTPPPPEPAHVEPRTEVTPAAKADPLPVEPPKPDSRKVVANLTPVVRKPPTTKTTTTRTQTDAQAKEADAQRKRALAAIDDAAAKFRDGPSGKTTVDVPGPGGGGPSYANYRDFVGSRYYDAWLPPQHVANDNPTVEASVTIASDGKVISAFITRRSGDPDVDASVQRTLDRVVFIAPFPAGATDRQRTYPILFDLKAKRSE